MIYIYNDNILDSKRLLNSSIVRAESLNKFGKVLKVLGSIILGITAVIVLISGIFIWFY